MKRLAILMVTGLMALVLSGCSEEKPKQPVVNEVTVIHPQENEKDVHANAPSADENSHAEDLDNQAADVDAHHTDADTDSTDADTHTTDTETVAPDESAKVDVQ